jgi:hypothetical protein
MALWVLRSGFFPELTPLEMLLVEIPLGATVYGAVIAIVRRESPHRLYS